MIQVESWTMRVLNFKMAFEELFHMLLPLILFMDREQARGQPVEILWTYLSRGDAVRSFFGSYDGSTSYTKNISGIVTVNRPEVCGCPHKR